MERNYDYSEFKEPINCQFTVSTTAGNSDFHMHNSYEVYLLLNGTISYFVEQSCYHMVPGDIILFTSQEIHKALNPSGQPFTRMVLHLHPSFVRQFCTDHTDLLSCFHTHLPGIDNMRTLTPDQQSRFEHAFHQINHFSSLVYGDDLHAVSALLELLLMIHDCYINSSGSIPVQPDSKIRPMMNYIDAHLSEVLTLDIIANALSIDKYYLSHLFKKETESTIFQYILVKRVALAKEFLSQDFTVTESCQLAGFNDYSNFIRTFKKVTGYSPGRFKKMVGE